INPPLFPHRDAAEQEQMPQIVELLVASHRNQVFLVDRMAACHEALTKSERLDVTRERLAEVQRFDADARRRSLMADYQRSIAPAFEVAVLVFKVIHLSIRERDEMGIAQDVAIADPCKDFVIGVAPLE